jgi:pimeloyl-ACP methyl ester carboxylesterase
MTTHTLAEHRVRSDDGTTLAYHTVGEGPGLVVVHGALQTGKGYLRMAERLADSFTVHLMDRRGRGGSGPQGDGYTLAKEERDLCAVLADTGAGFVFGHSFGGLVAARVAGGGYPVVKLALYEPGIEIGTTLPRHWIPAYARALEAGESLTAFRLLVEGLGLPAEHAQLPDWIVATPEVVAEVITDFLTADIRTPEGIS